MQHSRNDEADAQFDPEGPGLEPRMAALAISNDALLDSLRPVAPPSVGGWIKKQANPWWRHIEYGYTELACWLPARAPWQRWALSGGMGALLGVAIVVVALPRFRPDLESVASASGEAMIASTQLAAASAMMIAPLRPGPPSPVAVDTVAVETVAVDTVAVDTVKAAPVAEAELALPEPDAPTAVEVDEPLDDEPEAAPESGKVKKKKARKHGKRRARPKNAGKLGELFKSMHRPSSARAQR
ncbi:MAG: hypothetical protein ABI895_04580 [Deltaproteobacteria bacterium]